MSRKIIPVLFFLIYSAMNSTAEVTRLPFFPPDIAFTETPKAFPSFSSWMLLDHVLNQNDSPNSAHCFDTGSIFTFYSNSLFSVSTLARELFQFQPSPDGEFNFWARALVTDLRLMVSVNLKPFVASGGYRHDCKHDISDTKREVIHDAVFIQARLESVRVPLLNPTLNSMAGFNLELETNTPLIFQPGEEEPDRARLTLEGQILPFVTKNDHFRTFIDGRVSLLNREGNDRIEVASPWNVDWLVRAGAETRSGQGGMRLAYSLERITDDWASIEPAPHTLSAVTLLVFFDSTPSPR